MSQEIVKSVGYSQTEILKDIIKLYIPTGRIEADVTYSKGVFYKDGSVKRPRYRFDILPQTEDTRKADCRDLPIKSNSIGSMIFDPPFLATSGKSLEKEGDNNLMLRRFGYYPNERELHRFYREALREAHRVLLNEGILIVKCQDKISSGKQYLSHVYLLNCAIEQGFYPEDIFVLIAKSRLTADWQAKNQKHSRKFHSYFIVLRKSNTRIQYE